MSQPLVCNINSASKLSRSNCWISFNKLGKLAEDNHINLNIDTQIPTSSSSSTTPNLMGDFNEYVENFNAIMNQLKRRTKAILLKTDNFQAAININEEENERNSVNNIMDQCKDDQSRAKELLDKMRADAKESEQNYPKEPETRNKLILVQTLTSEFKNVLTEVQYAHETFSKIVKENIQKKISIG